MTGQQTPDTEDESYLEALGANTREPADTINVGVSGTVGPDYLGQQSVDVDGHPCDRPGVRSRLPDRDDVDPEELNRHVDGRIHKIDTGRELPVLLESEMRADPIEGTQGSYTQIVEGECARCGYDRLRESVHTMPGERQRTCNACGAIQDNRADEGYRMPKLDSERADEMRESGEKLGEAGRFDVYDMEADTGMGPYLYLINGDTLTLMDKETPFELYRTATRAGGGTGVGQIADDCNDDLDDVEKILLAHALTPEGVSFEDVQPREAASSESLDNGENAEVDEGDQETTDD